jgi:hypothetical protein
LGYVPRYIAYKTDVDCVDGAVLIKNLFVMEKRDVLGVLSNSEFTTVRPIDQLRFVEELDGSIRFVSDATLLLNEQQH